MVDEQAVEEGLVAVLQRGQADVPLEVVGLGADLLELESDLLSDGQLGGGEQSPQAEGLALRLGERVVLVVRSGC